MEIKLKNIVEDLKEKIDEYDIPGSVDECYALIDFIKKSKIKDFDYNEYNERLTEIFSKLLDAIVEEEE